VDVRVDVFPEREEIIRKEFQGNGTMEARVLGLVDHAHSATIELFDDAVVRSVPADERLGFSHVTPILLARPRQVNEGGPKGNGKAIQNR
jgi:hypothetical protein